MEPRDFINFARDIIGNSDAFKPVHLEAAYRTAISRLYYGVLHWMQKRFSITVPQSKIQTYHSYVIQKLESLLDDDFLIDFHFLMKARVDADYLLEISVQLNYFKECSACCERILSGIEEGIQFAYDPEGDLKYFKEYKDKRGNGLDD